MTSITIDRLDGLSSATAVKGPCRLATTGPITLSGLQTINGELTNVDDRVLVKNQVTLSENGIYIVDTGPWRRAVDFSKARDVRKGTSVRVTEGTAVFLEYVVTSANPIDIGTSDVTFALSSESSSGSIVNDQFPYLFLPRIAPALFNGTVIPYYVNRVKSCTGPLEAKHNIDLKYRFLELYGSQMGTEDVFYDPENTTGTASDAVVAGRGQFDLPYLTIAAAQGHANRRIIYILGDGTDDLFAISGSLKLNAAGTAPMPVMLIPFDPKTVFSFYGSGDSARTMQNQTTGWVPDVAGGKPEMYEKVAITSQEPEAIYVRLGDNFNSGEVAIAYYSSKTNAYNSKYGWFVDTGTKLISKRLGSLNLADSAFRGKTRIVWRRNSISTVQGCPFYGERLRFVGLSQQTRYQNITLLGVPTDVRAEAYWQDCIAEDCGGLAGFGWKNFGCITVYNRCQIDGSGYDGFNYDPDTYTGTIVGGTLTLPESAEIDCVARGPGRLTHRTLRSLIESGPFPGLRNLQASSIHEGYLARINCDYSDTLGQVVADTNAGEGTINIGCLFGDTRVANMTNPSTTPSPFPNQEDQYYDQKFPAAEFYGSVWNDSCHFGGSSSSSGASLIGGSAVGYTFNSSYEGTVATIGTFTVYNPSTGI